MDQVSLSLAEPPVVVNIGVGVHGVSGPRDVFRLPGLWQLHLYDWTGHLTVGGSRHAIGPGRVSLVPPGTEAAFDYRGRSEHLYAHLRVADAGERRLVPVVQDAGTEAPLVSGLLKRALAAMPGAPAQATAEMWTALWRVAGLAGRERPGGAHGAVAAAMVHIEAHLAAPLTVPEIARRSGVSHSHLTRLFRSETGSTVAAYIRARRLEHAGHLLRESTMSVQAIACSVGISDLQAFNKACHRELGGSPRAIRGRLLPGDAAGPG
ncbi:helix-turn-helix transcriptional regulator [Streptomyces sp. NPDC006682]|uniref:helix-turn-helix transcriptional regulator n=1 Tax=unclassified Streptomyces TaxID=2593676 RepID=UPI00106E813A|nr:AraC family transcriptional regulator [Streptomyces sp. S501]QBR10028.1 AraC family transcriptional regulator [Streptomyces sp. S501]